MENTIKSFDDYKNFQQEKKRLEHLQQKVELINSLNGIYNADGSPYFSVEWIKKHILDNGE